MPLTSTRNPYIVDRYSIYWIFPSSIERLAATPSLNEVGRIAWQQSDDTFWYLKSLVPLVWISAQTPYVPILQQELIGNIHNYYPDKIRGYVFGRAPVVNNTMVDLWDGPTSAYVFPTSAQQMQVVSSSVDDAAAGTGIRKVHIHYLDTNYQIRDEQVTLNGTTPVNTVATDILRINGFHAIEVGSGGVAVGNISLRNLAGTVTYGYISAGINRALQAVYTVPAGTTGYINHWQGSSGSTGNHFCQVYLRATAHDGTPWPGTFLVQDALGTQNGGNVVTFPIPIPVPEKMDIKLSAISDAANANVIALGAIMGWFETY